MMKMMMMMMMMVVVVCSMSSPPSYADLGKSARDLFSRGFSMQFLIYLNI